MVHAWDVGTVDRSAGERQIPHKSLPPLISAQKPYDVSCPLQVFSTLGLCYTYHHSTFGQQQGAKRPRKTSCAPDASAPDEVLDGLDPQTPSPRAAVVDA